jgi:hypothetical protein
MAPVRNTWDHSCINRYRVTAVKIGTISSAHGPEPSDRAKTVLPSRTLFGNPANLAHARLDRDYSSQPAISRGQIESLVVPRLIYNKKNNVILVHHRDVKPLHYTPRPHHALHDETLFFHRYAQQSGKMGWQLRMCAFSKGLVDRSNHPRLSMRSWRRARLSTQQKKSRREK